MNDRNRFRLSLIACLAVLCMLLTACPAPGDGTVDGGDAPIEETTEDATD